MNTPPPPTDHKARLKSALLAVREMRLRVETLERTRSEPLAIVGMGCRLPGNINSPDMYWSLLSQGLDATTPVPTERGWDIDQLYSADADAPGKLYVSKGGFLRNVDRFDAAFFGIPPREATHLDPQQRLLLEVGWEAFEQAGLRPDQLRGSRTGVFVGVTTNDYLHMQVRAADLTAIDAYSITGNHLNAAAGRLSYTWGLQGPSLAVDTACSSSLVTVHLACQSLRQGECDLALAGGVNLALSPDGFVAASRARMLAADGRCKTFDAAADGFARGEGCGLVVLKRLSDAIAQNDPILAVIRGSAVNQDGPSSGLTVPNGPAQQAVIRQALANGGVTAEQISYVEAHGTGTKLGDPIEIEAIAAELCQNRPSEQPLLVGAAKTNLGHLESAAGIAGLLKLVLSLQHQAIPPHLNFNQPNPHISWDRLPITVPTQLTPWPRTAQPRRAGLSGFGVSGTNAHIVVEEAPLPLPVEIAEVERPLHLLTLSAKSQVALQQLASRYELALVAASEPVSLADLCFSANTTRARFQHRLSAVASSVEQLAEQLAAFSTGQVSPGINCGSVAEPPKVAFLFTGEGPQFIQMGRQLYETQPTFRRALLACDTVWQAHPRLNQPVSLLDGLYPRSPEQAPLIDQPRYGQPILFALEYALYQLWQAWGVQPDWVLGQGIGEVAAACAAGCCQLADGLLLVLERAQMTKIAVGADNKSASTAPLIADSADRTDQVEGSPLRCGWVSSLTGEVATAADWAQMGEGRSLSSAVPFSAALETLQRQGCRVYVEIGPDPTLIEQGQAYLTQPENLWLPSLRRGHADWSILLETAATLNTHGVALDWAGFDRDYPRSRLTLPTYPFQRQRFWVTLSDRPTHQPAEQISGLLSAQTPKLTAMVSPDAPKAASLEQKIIDLAADVTGIQAQNLGLTQRLEGELGLDSIMLTQLMNGLIKLIPLSAQADFQLQHSLRDLFQLPHLQAVVDLLQPWQMPDGETLDEDTPNQEILVQSGPAKSVDLPTADAEPIDLLPGQYFHLIGHALVNSNSLFATVRVAGDFDMTVAQLSWQDLIARHPMLRSRFHIPPKADCFRDYRLEVLNQPKLPAMAFTDLRQLNAEAQANALLAEQQRWLHYPWSLTQWPLHQFSVVQLEDAVFQIFLGNEHLISDGLGNHILLHEFLELYRARRGGSAPDLPPATHVADYAATVTAMNAEVEAEAKQALLDYTHRQGKSTYYWNPDHQPFKFSVPQYQSVPYQLDRQTTQQLIARTREWRLPLNSLLTGAFLRALSRCDHQSAEIILQIPTGGRISPHVDASDQVSSFAQNLALSFERSQPQEDWTHLLQRVHQSIQQPLISGLDRAQTQKMALTFRDQIPLEDGQVPASALPIFHQAIKSNVYLPYTGHTRLQRQYGPLTVETYQAGGINAAGILDILQEIFDDQLHLFASYDCHFFRSAAVDQLMQAYQAQLRALAAVSPPAPLQPASSRSAPLSEAIATRLQTLATAICHIPISRQNLSLDLEADLGLDSLERIRLVAQIEQQWGQIDRKQLLSCRTLQEMAQHLQTTALLVR